jgi:hypothetical protein
MTSTLDFNVLALPVYLSRPAGIGDGHYPVPGPVDYEYGTLGKRAGELIGLASKARLFSSRKLPNQDSALSGVSRRIGLVLIYSSFRCNEHAGNRDSCSKRSEWYSVRCLWERLPRMKGPL